MREETEKDIYAAGISGREYDAACKRIFRNKEIIAPILKLIVPEYQNCTVEETFRCIDEDTIKDVPVEDIQLKIEGLPSEVSSVTEKLILYDVHFKAVNPVLSKEEICVHLHIDLEIQNEYKPGNPRYSIIKRALYYAVRELSAQLGTLTGTTNYNALEKVYSIWICNEGIPEELRDTATAYTIKKEDLIGQTEEPEEDFDLLNVIIVRRGGNSREKIFDYLTGVFNGNVKKIEEYTPAALNENLRQEAERMTGLGASLIRKGHEEGLQKGREEGIQKGREEGIQQEKERTIRKMLEIGLSTREILFCEECTEEEIEAVKEKMQLKEREGLQRKLPQRRR